MYENGEVKRVGEVELLDGNCMAEYEDILLFGSQANEDNPFVIHTLAPEGLGKISIELPENLVPAEIGFVNKDLLFVLFNSSSSSDSGVFLVNIEGYDFKEELSVKHDDRCQKLILQGKDDPDIFDGRIVVDRAKKTIMITGMVILAFLIVVFFSFSLV